MRKETVALGKLTLNLTKVPSDKRFGDFLSELIQKFSTSVSVYAISFSAISCILFQHYYLPLSLENMNKMVFTPCKDYEADRLNSGILQLPDRCNLLLDETAMQAGQLDEKGGITPTSVEPDK